MGKVVFHIQKNNSNTGGLGEHIDRKKTPDNVDQERTHMNVSLVERFGTLQEDVSKRIESGYQGKKAIRKDAVRSLNIICSGTHDDMVQISESGKLNSWAMANYKFIKENFGGEENIVRAELHMDEETPHIHFTVVPITKDGRLSAKEYIDGKKKLMELQTNYAQAMVEYGLERGIPNQKKKHTTTAQYYRYIEQNKLTAKEILQSNNSLELVTSLLEMAGVNQIKRNQKFKQDGTKRELSEQARRREKEQRRIEEQQRRADESQKRNGGFKKSL